MGMKYVSKGIKPMLMATAIVAMRARGAWPAASRVSSADIRKSMIRWGVNQRKTLCDQKKRAKRP